MATLKGETSACNTHVTSSTITNTHTTVTKTNIFPSSSTQTSLDSSLLHSPKPSHYNELSYERNSNVGDLVQDEEKKALVSTAQDNLNNIKANINHEQSIPNSDHVDFTNITHFNIPHHVQNDYLEKPQDNIVSLPVWSASPLLQLTGGISNSEPLPAQSLLPNYISIPSISPKKSLPFSYSPSSPKLSFPHGSSAPQTSFSNTSQCEPRVHQLTTKGDVAALQELLLSSPSVINMVSKDCTTPLHRASEHNQETTKGGHIECCQNLLKYDAAVMLTDQDGLTCLHYAVQHNHPHLLKSLLNKLGLLSSQHKDSELGYQLLAITDKDGWTITHMAAYLPKPDCLIILAESLNLDFEVKDKLGRSVRVVASPSCKEILTELDHSLKPVMKVNVELRFLLEKKVVSNVQIGALDIGPAMSWKYLEDQLSNTLSVYLAMLDAGLKTRRISRLDGDSDKDFSLGVMVANVTQYELGYYKWTPGMLTDTMPYVMLSNNQHRKITVIVDDTGNMNELIAFDVLQPVSTINNYLRLLEQYKTVIFYGPAGSGKSYLAQRLAQSIAAQELSMGRKPAIYQLSLDNGYSWSKFYTFLTEKNCVVPTDKVIENIAPIVVLDNLEKVDLSHIFGGLLDAMEYRGMKYAFALRDGQQGENRMHFLADHFYIIGTMNKSRSLGVDLSILPRFRWVQFRLDTEPLRGLLARHFMRRMYNTYNGQLPSPDNPVLRAIEWIVCVWHRLNDSLNKLGLSEVVIGPCMFFKCPLEKQDPKLLLEWVKNFWNKKVAPCVREAVKRGTGSESPSDGHNKVANTALYVLMQRSIMLSCPLTGQEKDNYLAGFSGSNELDIPLKSNTSLSGSTQSNSNAGSRYMPSRKLRNETDKLNAVTSLPSTASGVFSREENASSESNFTSKIKRRSLSESSVNKALQLEEQAQQQQDEMLSPSSQAKVAKLEVRSPKLVNIKSVFFTPLSTSSQKHDTSSFDSNLRVVKTGRVSPLLSLVSNRHTSPQKSCSTENISNCRVYSFGKAKSPGPFSFSLTAPKSNLDFLKYLDEEKLSKTLSEEMPDFSVFEKLSADELPQDFCFVRKDDVDSQVNSGKANVWNNKLDSFTVITKDDNSKLGSVPS
ncbi:hypothetical protein Btru_052450 [Bulinus truncatus]|nr:hypothetical protein Btru_052450 [Bulinus truncatus]